MAACSLVVRWLDVELGGDLLYVSFLLAIHTIQRVINAMNTKLAHISPTTVSSVPIEHNGILLDIDEYTQINRLFETSLIQ